MDLKPVDKYKIRNLNKFWKLECLDTKNFAPEILKFMKSGIKSILIRRFVIKSVSIISYLDKFQKLECLETKNFAPEILEFMGFRIRGILIGWLPVVLGSMDLKPVYQQSGYLKSVSEGHTLKV